MSTLTYKIALYPICKKKKHFANACGAARFTWNWALNIWQEKYKAGIKTSSFELKKEFQWVYEVTKYASQHWVFLKKIKISEI